MIIAFNIAIQISRDKKDEEEEEEELVETSAETNRTGHSIGFQPELRKD